jgi:hypothetical protein
LETRLCARGVRFRDFGDEAERISAGIREHAKKFAERSGRPHIYLESAKVSKEQCAREIQERDDIQDTMAWIPLRKAVADINRRVDICRAANERYLEALGVVGATVPTHQLFDPVSKRITRRGRSYRGLRPIALDEAKAFAALLDGEFLLHGFRNEDIRRRLLPQARTKAERRRAAGKVTRLLRLFRAHGLIRKVSGTFNYRVTPKGQQLMSTSLNVRNLNLDTLAA